MYILISSKNVSVCQCFLHWHSQVNIMFIYGNSAFRDKDNKKDNAPHIKNDKKLIFHFFEEAVKTVLDVLLWVGAYVIIFSVIVNVIYSFLNNTAGLLISYLFEISNGLAIIKCRNSYEYNSIIDSITWCIWRSMHYYADKKAYAAVI